MNDTHPTFYVLLLVGQCDILIYTTCTSSVDAACPGQQEPTAMIGAAVKGEKHKKLLLSYDLNG
eukprot:scaffold41153_cov23-Prasinocladus_malaysianus.AAC.1